MTIRICVDVCPETYVALLAVANRKGIAVEEWVVVLLDRQTPASIRSAIERGSRIGQEMMQGLLARMDAREAELMRLEMLLAEGDLDGGA